MKLTFADSVVIYTGSKPEVREVYSYENGARSEFQSIDKETNLPLWSFEAEVICGEEVETMKIKIASSQMPELKPRTEHRVNGKVQVTPYVNGNNRVALSVTVRGEIAPNAK